MFGEQLGIQSAQECHFKGQSHVNLSEHNYCFFNVYILFKFSCLYGALDGGTPVSVIAGYEIMELFFGVRIILDCLKQKMKILGVV